VHETWRIVSRGTPAYKQISNIEMKVERLKADKIIKRTDYITK